MANLSAININVDKNLKDEATAILKDLGLNMSVAINVFLKQIVKRDGLPFEITNPKPSKEEKEALIEGEQIVKDIKAGKRKGYKNMNDLIKALNDD